MYTRKCRVETLEVRCVLSGDYWLSGGASLEGLIESYESAEVATGSSLTGSSGNGNEQQAPFQNDNSIYVAVYLRGPVEDPHSLLEGFGFEQVVSSPGGGIIEGYLALDRVRSVVASPLVAAVKPIDLLRQRGDSVGSVANAAEDVLRSLDLSQFRGLTGAGVRIGVISDGVDGLATSVSTGNLPGNVAVLVPGDGSEGLAMLELIHDIAPGAQLFFASGSNGEAAFAASVAALIDNQVDIIVDDLPGLTAESWFMDGPAALAYQSAVAGGVTVFSSAGNRGNDGYEAPTDFVPNILLPGGIAGTFHSFDGTGDFMQTVTLAPSVTSVELGLQFDQAIGQVVSDVRLWFFRPDGTVIGSTERDNNSPLENDPLDTRTLNGPAGGSFQIAVELVEGPAPTRIRWQNIGSGDRLRDTIEHLGNPGVRNTTHNPGHSAAEGVISVGATRQTNLNEKTADSSVGVVFRTLAPSGALLPVAVERGGVSVLGLDGVQTSVPDYAIFNGTSAAAPNVAAIAALLLESDPELTPAGVLQALTGSARDIGAVGFDEQTGAGVVDALGAFGAASGDSYLVGLLSSEYVVVNDTNDTVAGVAGTEVSLRSAVIEANSPGSNLELLLVSPGVHGLTRTGGGTDTDAINDLDVNGNLTIVGAGAGLSVIDTSGLAATANQGQNRAFHVFGAGAALDLSRVTVRGGASTAAFSGTAVAVDQNARVTLTEVAIVNNTGAGVGAAVRSTGGDLEVRRSVFTGNTGTAGATGAAIQVNVGANGSPGSLTIGESVFARNQGGAIPNVQVQGGAIPLVNLGNNLIDNTAGGFFDVRPGVNDAVGTATHVVTSIVDRVTPGDDPYALSLREAVLAANNAGGGQVWLPAWTHPLGLTGTEGGYNALVNDLDVLGNLTVVGAGAGLSVIDTSLLASASDQAANRAFHVSPVTTPATSPPPSLSLSRLTITGADNTGEFNGAAVAVDAGAKATLTEVAIASNFGAGTGVAVRSTGGHLEVRRSVFTANTGDSTTQGGAIHATISAPNAGSLKIGETIFALNQGGPNPNVLVQAGIPLVNYGNNFVDNTNGGFFNVNPEPTDVVGAATFVVTSVADRVFNRDNDYALSLREAVLAANAAGAAQSVWLPAWTHPLSLTGAEVGLDALANDLDVLGNLTVKGAGPGLSVIDTSGMSGLTGVAAEQNRAFMVSGAGRSLALSRLTVTGGQSAAAYNGTAVAVDGSAAANLTEVAVVSNFGAGTGVAVRSTGGHLEIRRSVFTGNTTDQSFGATVHASTTPGHTGSLKIGESIFALNEAGNFNNVYAQGLPSGSLVNYGNNLFDNQVGGFFEAVPGVGDHLGTPGYVVTSVFDSFDHADNARALSVREAVDLANNSSGLDEVWLPAWDFVLIRDRGAQAPLSTDLDVAIGDLDITSSLVVRGVANGSSNLSEVRWRQGVVDAVFDLIGDFNGNATGSVVDDGVVDSIDYGIWFSTRGSRTDLRADANDSGYVENLDYGFWSLYFGNTFTRFNVTA